MPKTKVVTKYVKNLTSEEYAQCYKLNLGRHGMMRDELEISRKEKDGAKAILIKNEEGKIISWSYVFGITDREADIYLYVAKSHRRKGLGSRMIKKAQKIAPTVNVFPHDSVSGKFFKTHENRVAWNKWDDFFVNGSNR